MKLITKQIERQLESYPIYSQEESGDQAKVICKFFAPIGSYKWYVLEAERVDDDYRFFGLVVNNYGDRELGYFMLSELESVRLPMGLGIERDTSFEITELHKLN